jgi:predicted ester cyclase
MIQRENGAVILLVSNTQYSSHPSGMPNMDWNGHKQLLAAITRAFPDLHHHHDIKDMIAEGDKVAVRLNVTGTHKGKFQGIYHQVVGNCP